MESLGDGVGRIGLEPAPSAEAESSRRSSESPSEGGTSLSSVSSVSETMAISSGGSIEQAGQAVQASDDAPHRCSYNRSADAV
jgi:hypothetical protein